MNQVIKIKSFLSTCIIFICCFTLLSCGKKKEEVVNNIFEKVDISQIPNTTIYQNDSTLKLVNGVYYLLEKPYSGFIKELYSNDTLKKIGSYLQGRQHGTTKTFFDNGKLRDERNYKNGIGYGRHFGFWENGNMEFDFVYYNDKKEGLQKKWYQSGKPYYALNFTNDRENGMQKAWRENGKSYINYEVKDGIKYGLQKAALCYTLKDQKIK